VVAALVIGLWYTVSDRLLTPDTRFLVPPPDAVLRIGFLDPFNRAELLDGLLLSARVAMLGLASAALIGICLAILMSQARWLERSVFPYLVLLQATPILALVPLYGFWFGYGFNTRVLVSGRERGVPPDIGDSLPRWSAAGGQTIHAES
jgi:NitT/TauT family transport system permease protein